MTLAEQIGILGAGRMGIALAIDFATAGFPVWLETRDVKRAMMGCERNIDELESLGVLTPAGREDLRDRITVVASGDGRPSPALVIECVPEDKALKLEVLRSLGERYPDAILATNTSSFSISELGEVANLSHRVVGVHFLNPPYMFRIVEFTPGKVAHDVRGRVMDLLDRAGKSAVTCEREVAGFLWNRLQFALLREAVALAEEGVATPADVDRVVSEGLAPRWVAAGPLATVALGGANTFATAADAIVPTLDTCASLPAMETIVGKLGDEASSPRAATERLRKLSRLGEVIAGLRGGEGDRRGSQTLFADVDHVGVVVRSIEQSAPWYREHLGLELLQVEDLSAISVRLAYFDSGNIRLQLVEPTGPGKVADFLDDRGEGLHHVCWAVDAISDALRAARVREGVEIFRGGLGHPACFLEERPNGLRIELIERRILEARDARH